MIMRNETMNINAVDALNETNNTNNTSKTKRDKKKEGDALYKTMDGLRNCVFTNGKGTDLDKFRKLYPLLETLLQDYKTNYGEDGVTRKVSEWLTNSKPYFPTLQAQAQEGGFSVNHDEIVTWHKPVYNVQLAIAEQCMKPYTQGRINEALQNFKALHDAFFTAVSEYYAHVGDDDNITSYRRWYERVKKYMPLLFDEDNETPRNPVQATETPQIQSQTVQDVTTQQIPCKHNIHANLLVL